MERNFTQCIESYLENSFALFIKTHFPSRLAFFVTQLFFLENRADFFLNLLVTSVVSFSFLKALSENISAVLALSSFILDTFKKYLSSDCSLFLTLPV